MRSCCMVVIGGIGSITGSVHRELPVHRGAPSGWLRGLDTGEFLGIHGAGACSSNGFRMAVFSVIIMIVVLFFRKGIMGDRELPDLLRRHTNREGRRRVNEHKTFCSLDNVTMQFGGVVAVEQPEPWRSTRARSSRSSVPNGAGKTTAFNMHHRRV